MYEEINVLYSVNTVLILMIEICSLNLLLVNFEITKNIFVKIFKKIVGYSILNGQFQDICVSLYYQNKPYRTPQYLYTF